MRKTETELLQRIANRQPLTRGQIDALVEKIGKGQTKSRARLITESTEAHYAAQIGLMTPAEQQTAATAINSYTQSSTVINTACRTGGANPNITLLDQTFAAFNRIVPGGEYRVCYRLMTYKATDHMPYGATTGHSIGIGDYIRDAAYVSASENRQLLVEGVQNAAPGTRYVKMAVLGRGGINISGGSPYNNHNEEALLKQLYPKTWRVRTAHAGQAEVLYERNKVFRVQRIKPSGSDVHVVLIIPSQVPGGANIKNSFTGA